MKHATTFHSEFTNCEGLVIDGVPHLSITGATKLMYGRDGGKQLSSLRTALAKKYGVQTPAAATDFSVLPGICTVLVERENRGTVKALAMSQEVFIEMLWLYAFKTTNGGKRANTLLKSLAGVSLDLKLRQEAGLLNEEASKEVNEAFAKFFKPMAGNEKADPITEFKSYLIASGQKDRTRNMGKLVNEYLYNRLPLEIHDELTRRAGAYRGVHQPTKWQHLSPEAQSRLTDIVAVAIMLLEDEMADDPFIGNHAPIIMKLDRLMPRQRHSGYAPLLIQS